MIDVIKLIQCLNNSISFYNTVSLMNKVKEVPVV